MNSDVPLSTGRRRFLASAAASSLLPAAAGLPAMLMPTPGTAGGFGNGSDFQRANRAFQIRLNAALSQRYAASAAHPTNGDEQRYPNRIASFSKALSHDALGQVDLAAYDALLRALASGVPASFAAIPTGGPVKLGNPQAALSFGLEGADSHALGLPAPPAFASEAEAAEMAEIYWHALTRDVPFAEYGIAPQGQGLLGYTEYVARNPDAVRRFIAATTRAFKETSRPENFDEAIKPGCVDLDGIRIGFSAIGIVTGDDIMPRIDELVVCPS